MLNSHKVIVVLITFMLVSSCTSNVRSVIDATMLALEDRETVFSAQRVRQSSFDLMQIKAGERPQSILALAYIENNIYKWVSADQVVVNFNNGVIVKTSGLVNDLQYTSTNQIAPRDLIDTVSIDSVDIVDLEEIGYGIERTSNWVNQGLVDLNLDIFNQKVKAIKVSQEIMLDLPKGYPIEQQGWTNEYYLSPITGDVLASNQQLMPDGDTYKMVFSSQILRLYPNIP